MKSKTIYFNAVRSTETLFESNGREFVCDEIFRLFPKVEKKDGKFLFEISENKIKNGIKIQFKKSSRWDVIDIDWLDTESGLFRILHAACEDFLEPFWKDKKFGTKTLYVRFS